MVPPSFVEYALRAGADGVLVAACREGDCEFRTGDALVAGPARRAPRARAASHRAARARPPRSRGADRPRDAAGRARNLSRRPGAPRAPGGPPRLAETPGETPWLASPPHTSPPRTRPFSGPAPPTRSRSPRDASARLATGWLAARHRGPRGLRRLLAAARPRAHPGTQGPLPGRQLLPGGARRPRRPVRARLVPRLRGRALEPRLRRARDRAGLGRPRAVRRGHGRPLRGPARPGSRAGARELHPRHRQRHLPGRPRCHRRRRGARRGAHVPRGERERLGARRRDGASLGHPRLRRRHRRRAGRLRVVVDGDLAAPRAQGLLRAALLGRRPRPAVHLDAPHARRLAVARLGPGDRPAALAAGDAPRLHHRARIGLRHAGHLPRASGRLGGAPQAADLAHALRRRARDPADPPRPALGRCAGSRRATPPRGRSSARWPPPSASSPRAASSASRSAGRT